MNIQKFLNQRRMDYTPTNNWSGDGVIRRENFQSLDALTRKNREFPSAREEGKYDIQIYIPNPIKYLEGGMLKLTKGIGLDSAVILNRQDEATSAFLHTPCREVRTPSKETYTPHVFTLVAQQEVDSPNDNDFPGECNLPTYQQVVEEYYNGY